MTKRALPLLMIFLTVASAAHAQGGGGHRGGGGGGRGGGKGGQSQAQSPAPSAAKAFTQPEITGVVKAIDPATGRVTIAYEAVEALGWPAGTQPFATAKSDLLKDLAVGEKVRFRLESQQIVTARPF